MIHTYEPSGVCSSKFIIEIDEVTNKIINIQIIGGCPGNTQGVCRLCQGRDIDEIISLLDGIQCGVRGTSCPDQLAKALKEIKQK